MLLEAFLQPSEPACTHAFESMRALRMDVPNMPAQVSMCCSAGCVCTSNQTHVSADMAALCSWDKLSVIFACHGTLPIFGLSNAGALRSRARAMSF